MSCQDTLGPYPWEDLQPEESPPKRIKTSVGERVDMGLERENMKDFAETHPDRCKPEFLKHPELVQLPRAPDLFWELEKDRALSYSLPPPGSTAGKVLEFACSYFERLLKQWAPMTFKFGFTHDPGVRYYNPKFGYASSKDRFERMHVIYASSTCQGPAFLEAALIQRFGSTLVT